jgi:uncharacterized protein (DUF433 family)
VGGRRERAHRITVNPEQSGGRPSIRGLRVRVKDVLELLAAGVSREEILTDYPYLKTATSRRRWSTRRSRATTRCSARTECGSRSMRSSRRRWRAGLPSRGTRQNTFSTLGWPELTTGRSGRTPSRRVPSSSRRTRTLPNAGRAGDGPSIVWVRVGNTSRRDLLPWFRFRLPAIVDALHRGEALIEIV